MEGVLSDSSVSKLKATFGYVLLGLVMTAVSNFMLMPYASMFTLWPVVGVFVALVINTITLALFKNVPLFMSFTSLMGVLLVPLIAKFVAAGALFVVAQAIVGTFVFVASIGLYAITTKRNFLNFGTILTSLLLVLIVLMISNIFIGSSILSLGISYVAIVLFGVFLVFDIQSVIRTNVTPIEGAVGIYLDIINIFVHLLNILYD